MARDGTVMLYAPDPDAAWYVRFLQRTIQKVTGSPYTHVAVFCNGITWESTMWVKGIVIHSGVKMTSGMDEHADVYLNPHRELTASERNLMLGYLTRMVNYDRPYNVLKLVTMAITYRLRPSLLPFDAEWLGQVCSTLVDKAYKEAGIDLLPDEDEGLTAPGDFLKSAFFSPMKTATDN